MSGYNGLIQPIVVRRSGTHEQMVEAAALASVAAWFAEPDAPVWEEWLSGAFAKTVRRARPVEVEKVQPYVVAAIRVGDAEAFAMLPHDKATLPREVAKLQVSGLDAERTGWTEPAGLPPGAPTLVINADAGMTTGKTCAQAAHGLFAWALSQKRILPLEDWAAANMPFAIREVDRVEFERLRACGAVVVIEDAGHTEVDPGTATVLVLN